MVAGLINSRRMLLQATHTPIATSAEERNSIRALERRALVKSLRLGDADLESIERSELLDADELGVLRELTKNGDFRREVGLAARLPANRLAGVIEFLAAPPAGGA